jgi:hypothetical protein
MTGRALQLPWLAPSSASTRMLTSRQKAEEKKAAAERKRKEDLERSRLEMERRIAYLNKHGL